MTKTRPSAKRPPGRPAVGALVSVRLDAETIRRLDAIAAERGTSRAQVIRDALDRAICEQEWRDTQHFD